MNVGESGSGSEKWPACERQTSPKCDGEVNPKRWALGYRSCVDCGDGKKEFTSAPMHKSGYVLVTNAADLKFLCVATPREGQNS
jgi:hypothetical protein